MTDQRWEYLSDLDTPSLLASLKALSPEEFASWAAWEPEPVPLANFDLSSLQGRKDFLYEYYMTGETALFAAVAHVWAFLQHPKEARCTLMGLMSGTGGEGKTGLLLTLQQFLAEGLASIEPLPDSAGFNSPEAWNYAVGASFVHDEEKIQALCAQYSAILDGAPPPAKPCDAKIISGPWKVGGVPLGGRE